MKKILATIALLIAAVLMAIPMSARAATAPPTVLAVGQANGELGSQFTADILVNDVSNLFAYEFNVHYDPSNIQVVSMSKANTALVNGVAGTSCNTFTLENSFFNLIGQAGFAIEVLGPCPVNVVGSAALLHITFQVVGLVQPLPSPITITDDILATSSGSWSHSVSNGSFSPAANLGLRSVGCRAVIQGFNTFDHGTTDGLFCKVTNTGSIAISAQAEFKGQSVGGSFFDVFSPIVTIQPGQSAQLDASVTLPVVAFDVFTVTGTPMRIVTLSDSSTVGIAGPSNLFKINDIFSPH